MEIGFKRTNDYDGISIFANGVFVGVLLSAGADSLSWYAGINPRIVKYSLSDVEKFDFVLKSIIEFYKNEKKEDLYVGNPENNRYRNLIIGISNDNIGSWFDESFWNERGFVLGENPVYYVLKE